MPPARADAEEPAHQDELAEQQRAHDCGKNRARPAEQQSNNDELGDGHHDAGKPRRAINSELHRQRAHAHAFVALDRFEIVERHDAMGADAIEQGERDDSPIGQARRHHRGARKPGQPFVADRHRRIAPPAVLLQPHRRRAVGPSERETQRRRDQDPNAERRGEGQRQRRPQTSDVEAPSARNAS